MNSKFTTLIAGAAVMTIVLWTAVPARAGDMQAEKEKIREAARIWVAAFARKDVKAIVGMYSADGLFMPPNSPQLEGREAIGKAWSGLLKLPGVTLTFRPTRIVISEAADMATEIGTYALAFEGKKGRVRDRGKYVVVWKKVGGEWKALADIFNTNLPAQ